MEILGVWKQYDDVGWLAKDKYNWFYVCCVHVICHPWVAGSLGIVTCFGGMIHGGFTYDHSQLETL